MWSIDWQSNTILHQESGFQIKFEGTPETRSFIGIPHSIPSNYAAVKVAKLIRLGFDFYREEFVKRSDVQPARRPILSMRALP